MRPPNLSAAVWKSPTLWGDPEERADPFHVSHLFFFGVQLEALVQGAAMLLQMLLLLIPHTLCIFHHLFLDAAKETAGKQTVTLGGVHVSCTVEQTGRIIDTRGENSGSPASWYACKDGKNTHHSFVLFSHSITSFACGGPPEPQSFRALQHSKRGNCNTDGTSCIPVAIIASRTNIKKGNIRSGKYTSQNLKNFFDFFMTSPNSCWVRSGFLTLRLKQLNYITKLQNPTGSGQTDDRGNFPHPQDASPLL